MSAPDVSTGINGVGTSFEVFWTLTGGDAPLFYEVQVAFVGAPDRFRPEMWQMVDRGPDGLNTDPDLGVPKGGVDPTGRPIPDDRHWSTWPNKRVWTFPAGTTGVIKARARGVLAGGEKGAWGETPWVPVSGVPQLPEVVVTPSFPIQPPAGTPGLPPPPAPITPSA